MRIALLEDDETQQELTQAVVRALGHDSVVFVSGRALMHSMRKDNFDLLVLDWCVPDATGYEVLQWVRLNIEDSPPVLFVTNQMDEQRIVAALTAGADDYMVKPIRVSEFAARLKALLRRAYPLAQRSVIDFGDYQFMPQQGLVTMKGEAVDLKPKEFALACVFFNHPGKLLRRSYLQAAVWGNDTQISSRTLDTHVSRVRIQLNLRPDNGYRLSSVYSHGYRFEPLGGTSTPSPPAEAWP